ncbi:MAG: hypothetical protein K1X88_25925 [Nannocystaceae bacterium]|nr:hypothetical protein [Nannocystaceae bacterium]
MAPRILALALLAASTGCLDDTASGSGDGVTGGGASTGESADEGGSTGAGESDTDGGGGTTSGADETGLTAGSDTATGADTGDMGDPNACAFADCGARGSCMVRNDGTAVCSCASGQVAAGLTCLDCTPVAGQYDVEVASVDARVILTAGGEPLPAVQLESASIELLNPASGERVVLGTTDTGNLTARVIPARYHVLWRWRAGQSVAGNTHAIIGNLDATGTGVAEIDLSPVTISGRFSFDHVDAQGLQTEYGRVWLRNVGSGDEVLLGETRYGDYSAVVLPGNYEIHYEGVAGQDIAPANRRASLGPLSISADGGDAQVFDIDVATVAIDGSYQLDGGAPPAVDVENARISLRDPATGDEFVLGETRFGSYGVRVVPGQYEIIYEGLSQGTAMPINLRGALGMLDTARDSGDIAIASATISGAFSVDGVPTPADANDDGVVQLRSADGGVAVLGNTAQGSYERVVLAGSYEVHYVQDTAGELLPVNADAAIGKLDTGDGVIDIDIPTVLVDGVITIGAGAPPDSDYDDGWIYLRDTETGDSVLLANTRSGGFATLVVPGTYQLIYAVETAGGQVPINTEGVLLDTVQIDGDQALDVDVPVSALAGAIANVGGEPVGAERGSVYLAPVQGGARSLLGSTADAAFAKPVMPGRYLVRYGADVPGAVLPRNPDAPLACIELGG